MRICALLIVSLYNIVSANIYEGHRIIRVVPENEEHMRVLRSMEDSLGYEVDFIRNIHGIGRPGDMVVSSKDLNNTLFYFKDNGLDHKILEDNFAQVVRRERRALTQTSNTLTDQQLISTQYLSFDKQMEILDRLAAQNPTKARIEQIGVSTEGRPIKAVWIGFPSKTVVKPILWIDAGIHAREWIAPATAMYSIWHLLNDRIYTNLLRRIDIVIIPNLNPDGYEYSRLHERLWRKTRSKAGNVACYGVDANRNFPFHWGEEGVSRQSCKEIYCGGQVMSEPEVRALVNAMQKYKSRIGGYITLHSYGQDILYPYGHTVNQYPADVDDLIAMGNQMAAAIRSVNGTVYTVTNSAGGLYPASGASDDWAKSIGIKYSYTIELSPRTTYYGFELPDTFIEGVSRETLRGMLELGKSFVKAKGRPVSNEASRARINDGAARFKSRSQGRQG